MVKTNGKLELNFVFTDTTLLLAQVFFIIRGWTVGHIYVIYHINRFRLSYIGSIYKYSGS